MRSAGPCSPTVEQVLDTPPFGRHRGEMVRRPRRHRCRSAQMVAQFGQNPSVCLVKGGASPCDIAEGRSPPLVRRRPYASPPEPSVRCGMATATGTTSSRSQRSPAAARSCNRPSLTRPNCVFRADMLRAPEKIAGLRHARGYNATKSHTIKGCF